MQTYAKQHIHRNRLSICVRIDDGPSVIVTGRDAWALLELKKAGERGASSFDRPAPRWSSYIHKLRALGISIDTVCEPHSGQFPGKHGRYVLRSSIEIATSEIELTY